MRVGNYGGHNASLKPRFFSPPFVSQDFFLPKLASKVQNCLCSGVCLLQRVYRRCTVKEGQDHCEWLEQHKDIKECTLSSSKLSFATERIIK